MLSSIISGVKLLRGLRGFLYISDSRFDIDWVLPNNTCKDKSEILPSNFIGRNSVFADKHFTEKIDLN